MNVNNPNFAGEGQDAPRDMGLKVVGIAVVLLLVLAVLYWGGRALLLRPIEQKSAAVVQEPLGECTEQTTFTSLEAAMQAHPNTCALILRDKGLAADDLAGLSFLSGLRQLDISGNRLTTLPPQITQLGSSLQRLDAHNNQITVLGNEIAYLNQLRQINLSNNQLTSLSGGIVQWGQVTEIDLSSNQLTTLPGEIIFWGRAERIDLRNNPLPPEQIAVARQRLPQAHIITE